MKLWIAATTILAIVGCAVPAPQAPAPAKERRLEEVSKHPEWPEQIKAWILKGEVHPGMTGVQVLAAWGSSFDHVATSETAERKTMTFFFRQNPYVRSDDQCPVGRWAVLTEVRKKDDGKDEHIAVAVDSW